MSTKQLITMVRMNRTAVENERAGVRLSSTLILRGVKYTHVRSNTCDDRKEKGKRQNIYTAMSINYFIIQFVRILVPTQSKSQYVRVFILFINLTKQIVFLNFIFHCSEIAS